MSAEQKSVTIFRSAERTGRDEAAAICECLTDAGLSPAMLTDSDPGIAVDTVEVRVPASEQAEAEQAIAAMRAAAAQTGDASENLNLVTLYEGVGTSAEIEALSIRAVLDASNIPSVLVGVSAIPNLPFGVKVPQSYAAQAQTALEEARSAGPSAAEEAEQATERSG